MTTVEIRNSIAKSTKPQLQRFFKHITRYEYSHARTIWLQAESFEDFFVALTEEEIPVSKQDAYALNLFIARYHNTPDRKNPLS